MTATRDLRRVSYPYGLGTGARRVYAYLETQRMMGQTEVSAWTLQQAMTRHSMTPTQVAMSCNQLEDGRIIARTGDDRDIDGIPLTVRLVALYSPPQSVDYAMTPVQERSRQMLLGVVACVSQGLTRAQDVCRRLSVTRRNANVHLRRAWQDGLLSREWDQSTYAYAVTAEGLAMLAES